MPEGSSRHHTRISSSLSGPAPYPEPHFSLQFLVPEEIFWTCENWERQDLDAWIERKLDWVEAQGLPSWMPDFLKSYQEHQWPGATWRDSYRGYIAMFTPRESEFQLSITSKSKAEEEHRRLMTEFAAKVAEYEKIESRPGFRKRSPNIDQWTEDDPLKPFALAAIIALEDLKTGVRVRDSAINAFGVMPEMAPEEVVIEPGSAGYAIGGLFNQAPQKCAELYNSRTDMAMATSRRVFPRSSNSPRRLDTDTSVERDFVPSSATFHERQFHPMIQLML